MAYSPEYEIGFIREDGRCGDPRLPNPTGDIHVRSPASSDFSRRERDGGRRFTFQSGNREGALDDDIWILAERGAAGGEPLADVRGRRAADLRRGGRHPGAGRER